MAAKRPPLNRRLKRFQRAHQRRELARLRILEYVNVAADRADDRSLLRCHILKRLGMYGCFAFVDRQATP